MSRVASRRAAFPSLGGGHGGLPAKILVVEDDPSVALTLAALLEAEGYQVDQAADLPSALAEIEAGPIEALLVDLRVGDADGMDVLRRLKELHPDAVGIVHTGYGTLESALLAMRAGADDFILKPSDVAELKASIARALHWRAQVAEREQAARAEAEATAEKLEFLAEATAVLAASLDYEATLKSLARLVVPRVADWCAVDIVTENGAVERLAVVHSDPDKVQLANELQERYPTDPNAPHGVPMVIRTGAPELYPEITEDLLKSSARDAAHLRTLLELGLASVLIVPLKSRDHTLGALTLVTAESGRRYGPGDLRLAQDLAHRAAMAIDNARLHRDLQARMDLHLELNAELRRVAQERDDLRRVAEDRVAMLEELDRVKEEFLATASHDLKNPLTSIRGHTQLLLRGMRAPVPELAQMAEALDVIDGQAAALTGLLDDLLDASSIQAGGLELRPAPCDLGESFNTVAARLSPQERERVETAFADAPLSGQWEARRIEQVLANLIGNALKYSPESERVTVTVERRETDWEVAIGDRGLGINPSELPRLFERFYRTPGALASGLSGTGLGLYICRGIITTHGGSIWAESSGEGQGATFRFTLPLEPRP